MKTTKHLWKRIFVPACLSLLFATASQAEDTYETLTLGTNTLKNVRIMQASPIDLLLGHDEGFKRIKLQELPDTLKAKYPYDAQKAADYEKQKAQEARVRQAQNAAAVRASLLVKEEQIRSKLKPLETELKRLNKDIATQDRWKKGKGVKSPDRQSADQLRARKMQVRDQIWSLKDELERTETQRRKYE